MSELNIVAYDPRGLPVTCGELDLKWMLTDKHPELKNRITKKHVEETISSPNLGIVYVSNHSADSNIYYRKFKEHKFEVEVIVTFKNKEFGRIQSIHFCKERSPGEKITWPEQLATKKS